MKTYKDFISEARKITVNDLRRDNKRKMLSVQNSLARVRNEKGFYEIDDALEEMGESHMKFLEILIRKIPGKNGENDEFWKRLDSLISPHFDDFLKIYAIIEELHMKRRIK